jgi:hypothetical protein
VAQNFVDGSNITGDLTMSTTAAFDWKAPTDTKPGPKALIQPLLLPRARVATAKANGIRKPATTTIVSPLSPSANTP